MDGSTHAQRIERTGLVREERRKKRLMETLIGSVSIEIQFAEQDNLWVCWSHPPGQDRIMLASSPFLDSLAATVDDLLNRIEAESKKLGVDLEEVFYRRLKEHIDKTESNREGDGAE